MPRFWLKTKRRFMGLLFAALLGLHPVGSSGSESSPGTAPTVLPSPSPAPTSAPVTATPLVCRRILRGGQPSSFDPLQLSHLHNKDFYKKIKNGSWSRWDYHPQSAVNGWLSSQLLNQSVLLAWALDRFIDRFYVLEGKVTDIDLEKKTLTLEVNEKGQRVSKVIPVEPSVGETLYLYLVPSTLPERTVLVPEGSHGVRRVRLAVVQKRFESELERRLRFSTLAMEEREKILRPERWILRLMDFVGREESASVIADSEFTDLMLTRVRFGHGKTAKTRVQLFFEDVEIAYLTLIQYEMDLQEIEQALQRSPFSLSLRKFERERQEKIQKAKAVLTESLERYVWVRRSLAAMADGFDACSQVCADRARDFSEHSGIGADTQKRYPDLLIPFYRPSIQEMQTFLESRPDLQRARQILRLKLEIASTLRSLILLQPFLQKADDLADGIPNEKIRSGVKRFLALLGDLRAQYEHDTIINKIRLSKREYPQPEDALPEQLAELMLFSGNDPSILVTFARTTESRPLFLHLMTVAKTRDSVFAKKMEDVIEEIKVKKIPDRSSTFKVSPAIKWAGALVVVGGAGALVYTQAGGWIAEHFSAATDMLSRLFGP